MSLAPLEHLAKAYGLGKPEQHSPMKLKLSMKTVCHSKLPVAAPSGNQHLQLEINASELVWLSCLERLDQCNQDDAGKAKESKDVPPINQRYFPSNLPDPVSQSQKLTD